MTAPNKPYYVVLDQDGVGLEKEYRSDVRCSWLLRSTSFTVFPSKTAAAKAIRRTRRLAKANHLPWVGDIRHYVIVEVTLSRGATLKP